MFCTKCGCRLRPGDSFCPNCHEMIPGVSGRVRQSQRGGSSTSLVVGIVGGVVALLVAAAGVLLLVSGGIDGLVPDVPQPQEEEASSAEYASDDTLVVSASTSILPKNADDEGLSSYTVRVKQADDTDGKSLRVDELPHLSIEGEGGFSLGDFGQVGEGTYWLSVRDSSGAVFDLPPLELGDGAGAPDEVKFVFPRGWDGSAPLSTRGKYVCFSGVLNGLFDTYGEPSLTVMRLEDEKYLAWAAGVSYAELVDFGDGVERLIVAYCKDARLATSDVVEIESNSVSADDYGPTAQDYQIEVYEYDDATDEAVIILKSSPASDQSNRPDLCYLSNPAGGTCLKTGGSWSGVSAYGLGETGVLGTVGIADWQATRKFRLVSVAASEGSALSDASANESSCEATVQTAKDLQARLEALSKF